MLGLPTARMPLLDAVLVVTLQSKPVLAKAVEKVTV
jgi:hypothetical protein